MVETPAYIPPKVWTWDKESGGRFASINRPIAGPTYNKELPVGCHPMQLYSLATPNGQKVTIMLEELLAAGHRGAEYDAWLIKIDGNQFGSGFVQVNPNSKIPALMDRSGPVPISARAGLWRPGFPVEGDHRFRSMATRATGLWTGVMNAVG